MVVTRNHQRADPMLTRFWNNAHGGVAPLIAMAIIPLFAAVGCAVDFGRANALRTAMQGALDSTALTLAAQNGQGVDQAPQIFNASFAHPEVQNLSVKGTADELSPNLGDGRGQAAAA
jgi:Flp pilus assembly protein TadG